jgi:AcrR family transcriptional regulator
MTDQARHGRATRTGPGVRERILDAAIESLAESGISGLTQIQVAKRAGVRQSHLTYYFPTRDDLLEAVTERAVEGIAGGLSRLVMEGGAEDHRAMLERLARSVADLTHMRMFVAMIVEADDDLAVRKVMTRATHRMEAALAAALGVNHTAERARLVLAAVWGLGLYRFLMRPKPKEDPTRAYLSWLAESSRSRPERPGGAATRKSQRA